MVSLQANIIRWKGLFITSSPAYKPNHETHYNNNPKNTYPYAGFENTANDFTSWK